MFFVMQWNLYSFRKMCPKHACDLILLNVRLEGGRILEGFEHSPTVQDILVWSSLLNHICQIEGKCQIWVNVTALFEVYLRFTCSSLLPSMKRRQSTPKKIKWKSSNIHFFLIFIDKREKASLGSWECWAVGEKRLHEWNWNPVRYLNYLTWFHPAYRNPKLPEPENPSIWWIFLITEAALASDHFIFGKGGTFPFMKAENQLWLLIKSLFYSKTEKSGKQAI